MKLKGYSKGGDLKYADSVYNIKPISPSQWDKQNINNRFIPHPGYAAGTKEQGQYKEYYDPSKFTPSLVNGAYKWSSNTDPDYDFSSPQNMPVQRYIPPTPLPKPDIEASTKQVQFSPSGQYNPNSGLFTTVNGQLIDPSIESKKKGGLVGKVKGYYQGGNIENEGLKEPIYVQDQVVPRMKKGGLLSKIKGYDDGGWVDYSADNTSPSSIGAVSTDDQLTPQQKLAKAKNVNAIAGSAEGIAGAVGLGLDASNAPNSKGQVDTTKAAFSGALKDGAAGAALGSFGGPLGIAIGGGLGALYGGIKGLQDSNSANTKNKNALDTYNSNLLKAKNDTVFNNSFSQQLSARSGYEKGGKIVGKGTSTSDSIKAKVEADSFVVPKKNAKVAEVIREEVLGEDPNDKAKLHQKGGKTVKLSNGEHLFTPEEITEIQANGIDLDKLAPESQDKLREHLNCGGMINEYSEGGKIEIKKSHRGEFTRFAREHGMTTRQATDHVLANKDKYDAHVVKMAAFAKGIGGLNKGGKVKGYEDGGPVDGNPDGFSLTPENRAKLLAGNKASDMQERANLLAEFKDLKAKAATGNPIDVHAYKARLPELGARLNNINQKYGIKAGSSQMKQGIAQPQSYKPATSVGLTNKVSTPSFAQSSMSNAMANQDADNNIQPPAPTQGLAQKVASPNAVDNVSNPNLAAGTQPDASTQQMGPTTGQRIGAGLSTLINYGLPIAQGALGLQYLKNAGARPVDQIDPAFNSAYSNAQSRASYGFTPEEQAQLNNQNNNLTSAQRFDARNYSGGSAGNAYNMERTALNDSYGRGLANAVQNRNLQLGKQQYADQLGLNKVELSRRLFNDKMNAWQQQQSAGQNLVGSAVNNVIDANRYEQEKAFQQQNAANANNWLGQ